MAPVVGSGSMPACNALVPNFISGKGNILRTIFTLFDRSKFFYESNS